MKTRILVLLAVLMAHKSLAQLKSFRFAFISDTHIGSPDGKAEQDLSRTVRDINNLDNIDFVVITGDITELGTNGELASAKSLLDSLQPKYYIIPGNHDDGWSESGGTAFISTFGSDRFHFDHLGIRFIGCASGPYVRMSDGHIPRDAMDWMQKILDTTPAAMPVVFLNHYPMDNQMDNWYEVVDMYKKRNTIMFLCGHGHINKSLNFEDIPGVMGRSNLRAKQTEGGYNLVDVGPDSILFTERTPVTGKTKTWTRIPRERRQFEPGKSYPRPAFDINERYPMIHERWRYVAPANVISTPAIINGLVVFGNQAGTITALDLKNGRKAWTFQTGASIFSSPAVAGRRIVLGSADSCLYCLNDKGQLLWKFKTGAAVLGSPAIENGNIFFGGSDHQFRSVNLETGKELWHFDSLNGPVVSTPVFNGNAMIFGAWDNYLYSLSKSTGKLMWKWTNGSTVRNFSPAACVPLVRDEVIYIAAPDRYLSAIDARNGQTLWRTGESAVRESIGISEDGKLIYGKTMNDTLVAYQTSRELQHPSWNLNVGYGYEHAPSMPVAKKDMLFFGTRNGLVYSVDTRTKTVAWAHKIDNSMVNTVNVISARMLLAATMDGKVVLLEQTN